MVASLLSLFLVFSCSAETCYGGQQWVDLSDPVVYTANKEDCFVRAGRYFESDPSDKRLVIAVRNDKAASFEERMAETPYRMEKGSEVRDRIANDLYVCNLKHHTITSIYRLLHILMEDHSVSYFERMYEGDFYSTIPNDIGVPEENDEPGYWYGQTDLYHAWDITTGSPSLKLGIIDSGINSNHQDFWGNLNTSLSVSCCDGISLNPLADPAGHGTLSAGIMAGRGNNSTRMCGTAWFANLVSIQACGKQTDNPYEQPFHETTISFVDSLNYAQEQGLKIVNFSGGFTIGELTDVYGSPNAADPVIDTIADAVSDFDGLLVVAAGNNYKHDIGTSGYYTYPATLAYSNILSVGASDMWNSVAYFSSVGQSAVDLFAPGYRIYGPAAQGSSGTQLDNGSSFAAPMVAGTAHLMRSVNSSLTPIQIRNLIINNVDQSPAYTNYCVSGGRLNSFKAVKAALPAHLVTETSFGGSSDYTINSTITHRWIRITTAEPGTYSISSSGNLSVNGKLYNDIGDDATLIGQGAAGSGGGGGPIANFAFSSHLPSAGDYYLLVERTSNSMVGYFNINASFVPD